MPQWYPVASLGEIEPGTVKRVELDEYEIGVYNLGGEYYAIDDVCTHQYALLSEGEVYSDEGTVECPLHGSEFDIRSGRPCGLPAVTPVATYEVRVADGQIEVLLP